MNNSQKCLTWKAVPSEPTIEAANNGWLRHTTSHKPLKPKTGSADHYPYIRYHGRKLMVHHLVCEAFHGRKGEPGQVCRHLDDNPENNKAENLAWGSRAQNNKDKIKNGSSTKRLDPGMRDRAKKLFAMSYTVAEVSRELGISASTAARIRGDMTSNLAAVRIAAVVLLGRGHEPKQVAEWIGLDEQWMVSLIRDVDKWDMQGNLCCQHDHQKKCANSAQWVSISTGHMVCGDHLGIDHSHLRKLLEEALNQLT